MTLKPTEAERLLRSRLGEPAKDPTQYVIGFRTRTGKLLAMYRTISETRVWFQPPAPPALDGVTLLPDADNGNSNINGALLPLSRPDTLRVEIDGPAALQRFLDWYEGGAAVSAPFSSPARNIDFRAVFARFQALVTVRSGHKFETFQDGLAAAWESYKPLLRDHALKLMAVESWDEGSIGSGAILERVIAAIEIQKDSRSNLTNNLVFWQNRYGHANREHRLLIEALEIPRQRQELEQLLFNLYRKDGDPSVVFNTLA